MTYGSLSHVVNLALFFHYLIHTKLAQLECYTQLSWMLHKNTVPILLDECTLVGLWNCYTKFSFSTAFLIYLCLEIFSLLIVMLQTILPNPSAVLIWGRTFFFFFFWLVDQKHHQQRLPCYIFVSSTGTWGETEFKIYEQWDWMDY